MKLKRRTELSVCVAAIGFTLGGLGTVVAQTDFAPGKQRAARVRPNVSTMAIVSPRGTQFGDPLPGLTTAQLGDFAQGLQEFQSADTPASGLGPIYNNVSCVACHFAPTSGGGSVLQVTRFGRLANGYFDPMTEQGGSLLQSQAIDPAVQERIPAEANVIAKRQTTPLFGLGLIEAIADATIEQNATGRKPDGVSGRVSMVQDVASGQTRVGRFGWKAQQASLLSFAGDAYVNEIGITNRLFPNENAPNGNTALLARFDTVADPEDVTDAGTGKADIDRFADYMRYLAPPPRLPLTLASTAGAVLFVEAGCNVCHQAFMLTAANPVAALDRKLVPLFSDLLLHDMGTLGDGIAQGAAQMSEMRTAPLWGLRMRTAFLHDGRATTVDAAIRMHAGEAAKARDRFVAMPGGQQDRLLQFLGSI